MGRGRATRVTAQDLAKCENIPALIKVHVKNLTEGDTETKEASAGLLRSLGQQNHGEYADAIFHAGAVGPMIKLLTTGSAKAQASAAGALHAIASGKESHQHAVVSQGGVGPLVKLVKGGSPKVQEEVGTRICWSCNCVHALSHS